MNKFSFDRLFLFLFAFAFVITYWEFPYSDLCKYLNLAIFQIYLAYKSFFGKNKLNGQIFKLILLLTILMSVSVMVNMNNTGVVKFLSLVDFFILVFLLFPKAFSNMSFSKDEFLVIIGNAFFVGLLISFFVFYNDLSLTSGRVYGKELRHLFGFYHPSIGGFLCFVCFSLGVFSFCVRKKGSLYFIFCLLKVVLPLYMIFLIDIRASMIACFAFVLLFFANKIKKKTTRDFVKRASIFFSFIFVFGLITLIIADFTSVDLALSGRLSLIKECLTYLISNGKLLFGDGSFKNSDVLELGKLQIDNAYIDVLYQYGIFAFFAFLIFLFFVYKKAKRIKNKNSDYYSLFAYVIFCSTLIYSFFEKNLLSLTSALSVIVFATVFVSLETRKRQSDRAYNKKEILMSSYLDINKMEVH